MSPSINHLASYPFDRGYPSRLSSTTPRSVPRPHQAVRGISVVQAGPMVELDPLIRAFYRERYVEDDRLARSTTWSTPPIEPRP
jgi:hypothetical protein